MIKRLFKISLPFILIYIVFWYLGLMINDPNVQWYKPANFVILVIVFFISAIYAISEFWGDH